MYARYKTNPEKVSSSHFPKDEKQKEMWSKSIPRKDLIVNSFTVVCEKQFQDEDIIRTWESGTGDKKVVVM